MALALVEQPVIGEPTLGARYAEALAKACAGLDHLDCPGDGCGCPCHTQTLPNHRDDSSLSATLAQKTSEGSDKTISAQPKTNSQETADCQADAKPMAVWSPDQGAVVLDELRSFVARYVVVAPPYLDVITLWVASTYVIDAAETTPRLLIKSAEKESGKSRLLEVLDLTVATPLQVMNTTTAAIFRLLKTGTHTILFDEVDAVFAKTAEQYQDMRALLNAGYRRGAVVARVVGEGKGMKTELFPVFAATALAAIGDLPNTIESRSIVIPMRRRAPDEALEFFRLRDARKEAEPLRARLAGFSAFVDELASARPVMPEGVTDRAADCWEILLAIADLAGGDWPKRARDAAVLITSGRVADDLSTGVRLLADIHAVFNPDNKPAIDKIASAALVEMLNALGESPWGGWHDGKGMTQRDLARRVKPYNVHSKDVRLPDGTHPKGYERDQFADAFARYLRLGKRDKGDERDANSIRVAEVALIAHTHGESEALSRVPEREWPLSRPADPRDDLTEDSDLWRSVLTAAHAHDADDPEGLYGALSGLRCVGVRLAHANGSLKLLPGEIGDADYQDFRARHLVPHEAKLRELLRHGVPREGST